MVLLLATSVLRTEPVDSADSGSTDISTAISRGLHWIETHPASVQDGGLIDLIDEGVAFYLFQDLARKPYGRRHYATALQHRMASLDALPEFSQWVREPRKRLLDHYHLVLAAWLMQRAGQPSALHADIVDQAQYALLTRSSPFPTIPLTIAVFLDHLGESPAIPMEKLLDASLIERIVDGNPPVLYSGNPVSAQQGRISRLQVYALIHEVIALTDFGHLAPPPWLVERRDAVVGFLGKAMHWAMAEGNIDLLAEIIGSLFFLEVPPDATINMLLRELVKHQLPDGCWGNLPLDRQNKQRHAVLTATAALWAYGHEDPVPSPGRQGDPGQRGNQ
ncbi:MAG: hypothetical protein HKP57_04270 [Halobacteria archaeon]|nr:hypothetical protein [Halobacteria archaeon]